MKKTKIIFYLALALFFLISCSLNTASQTQTPETNAEIRQWYNDQVSVIPQLNEEWKKEGLNAEERARKAYEIRHNARLQAREMMPNPLELKLLRARDKKKYGHPDGPTFEYLVEKNRSKGMTGEEVYEAIIQSSFKTNQKFNEKYGVKTESDENERP